MRQGIVQARTIHLKRKFVVKHSGREANEKRKNLKCKGKREEEKRKPSRIKKKLKEKMYSTVSQ